MSLLSFLSLYLTLIPCTIEYKRVLKHYERYGRFAWEEFGGELERVSERDRV
jgi:hypothetical protein